jgi:murein hydrolase activator
MLGVADILSAQSVATHADDGLARRAAERLRTLHDEAERLTTEERGILNQLRKLELARQIAKEELRQADAAAAETGTQIEALDGQVKRLEAARNSERPQLESRLVEMYKLGRGRYARLLLSASDTRKLGQASRTVAALAALDRNRMQSYATRLQELTATRQSLGALRRELVAKRATAGRAQGAAARAIADQTALVREIDQRRDLNAQLASELMAAQQKLETTLANTSGRDAIALPIGPFRGALPWPAAGRVQRQSGGAMVQRPGIGIQADEGSPVQAVHDGIVAFAGSFDGLGNLVIVDHGGQTFTLYGYLLEMTVGRGAQVAARQPVGRVGATPTGNPLLYFEMRVNGHPVDPMAWLDRTR